MVSLQKVVVEVVVRVNLLNQFWFRIYIRNCARIEIRVIVGSGGVVTRLP